MTPLALPDNPRVLVVALRRLGDVLLTTPLIRSVKRAFPAGSIDVLVFAGTEGILSGNPDIAGILTIPQRPRLSETLALMRRLARRYDLAHFDPGGRPPHDFGVDRREAKCRSGRAERTFCGAQAAGAEPLFGQQSRPASRQ